MRPAHLTLASLLFFLALPCALVLADDSKPAEPLKTRTLEIPDHGSLVLELPAAWKDDVKPADPRVPPTFRFSPPEGADFIVLITPLWSPKGDPNFNKPANVKRLLENEARILLPQSVEKELPLQEFKARDGTGYYFGATDKSVKPDNKDPENYLYVVRSGVGVGDLLLSVTVLCRSKDSPAIPATLHALEKASQKQTL